MYIIKMTAKILFAHVLLVIIKKHIQSGSCPRTYLDTLNTSQVAMLQMENMVKRLLKCSLGDVLVLFISLLIRENKEVHVNIALLN